MEYQRILKLEEIEDDSLFLWGPRQVGKSTLLRRLFPEAIFYDLLNSEVYERLSRHPNLLRQDVEAAPNGKVIIIDEVQKIPALLDEAHWLMVNRGTRFILCASSARKLKVVGTNLLGGRALKCAMYPLVSAEVSDFDLDRAINNGLLPRHYTVKDPTRRLQAYIGVYLNEEIRMEAQLRNLAAFNRFLEVAATCDGEIVNFSNIAQDCGVRSPTVKEYFAILQQTMIGYMIDSFTLSKKRRAITAPKFYYFDVGIVNYLLHRKNLKPGSADYGHAFEHLIVQEIIAWLGYSNSPERLTYWHTSTGYEVDCIIGTGRVAIEVRSTREVQSRHTKGLAAFAEEFPDSRRIIVSLDPVRRAIGSVEVIPAHQFLAMMWHEGL